MQLIAEIYTFLKALKLDLINMVTSFGTPMLFLFQYVCQKYNFFSQKLKVWYIIFFYVMRIKD